MIRRLFFVLSAALFGLLLAQYPPGAPTPDASPPAPALTSMAAAVQPVTPAAVPTWSPPLVYAAGALAVAAIAAALWVLRRRWAADGEHLVALPAGEEPVDELPALGR